MKPVQGNVYNGIKTGSYVGDLNEHHRRGNIPVWRIDALLYFNLSRAARS